MSVSLKTRSQNTESSLKPAVWKSEDSEEKSPRIKGRKATTVVEVHKHNEITDISDDDDNLWGSSEKQVEKVKDQGLDYPDQGQGQVEKHVHVTKSVEFKDESGHVETRTIEMTRGFASNQTSDSDIVGHDDFFD